MKHLPKHLQPRWRYLAVALESWPGERLDRGAFQRALWYSAQNLLGDAGSAAVDLSVVRFRWGDGAGEAVVRVRRDSLAAGRAALACVDEVEGTRLGLCVRGTSGTIRGCEEKYMNHQPIDPEQRHVAFDGTRRSAFVRNGRVDIGTNETRTGATEFDIR